MQNTYHYSAHQRIICTIGFICEMSYILLWTINVSRKKMKDQHYMNGNRRWKLLWQKNILLMVFAYDKDLCLFYHCFYASVQVFLDISYIFPWQSSTRLKAAVAGESREEELVPLPSASNVPKETEGTISRTKPDNKANLRKAGFWLKTTPSHWTVMMQITNCLFCQWKCTVLSFWPVYKGILRFFSTYKHWPLHGNWNTP